MTHNGKHNEEDWYCRFCDDFWGGSFKVRGFRRQCYKCKLSKGDCFGGKVGAAIPSQRVVAPPSKNKDEEKEKDSKDRGELAKLRREIADLKSQVGMGRVGSSKVLVAVEPDEQTDVQELNRAAESLAKALGADAAETLAVRQRLAEERKKIADSKPLWTQVRSQERMVAKRQKAADAAVRKAESLRQSALEAHRLADQAEAESKDLQRQVLEAEADIRRLREQELEQQGVHPETPANITAAASEVQRLNSVVQSLSTTSQENLPMVGESLRAIVAALVRAIPQATVLPITQHPEEEKAAEVDDEDLEEETDEFFEAFAGLDEDGSSSTSGGVSDQRRAQFKQFLAKNRYVKVKSKRLHG